MMSIKRSFTLTSFSIMAVSLASNAWAQAPAVNWSGPYVGAFGGYGSGSSAQHDNGFIYNPPGAATPPPGGGENFLPINADGHYGMRGGLGGGLVGYSYQYNMFVLGLEGDVAGTGVKGSSSTCGIPFHECGTNLDLMGDVRGRIGIPFGSFMPFVAGGLALDRIRAHDSLFGASGSTTLTGWTIGGGLEYKVTPLIALRLEYLHSQFDPSYVFSIVPGVPERVSLKTDVVRAGISFSFDSTPPPLAPVIAKY